MLRYDRKLGVDRVGGCDEAGRGCLAGPLVAAGVVFDYSRLGKGAIRLLACLDDSKRLSETAREHALSCIHRFATTISVAVIPPGVIDRDGLHRSNIAALRRCLETAAQDADLVLIDGFALGADAPDHRKLVRGDSTSAAIAAASIVAKTTRDRYMQRADALYPAYGFRDHVGYLTAAHAQVVSERGPCPLHRLSFDARCLDGHR